MLAIERRNQILAKLQQESKVVVSDLSQKYNVTEETIRRDLEKLEKQGFAKKTYGGAVLNESLHAEVPYNVRKLTNTEAKKKIADLVENLVEDGDRIMLDASSTALFIVKKLKSKKNLTIITNSIEIIIELVDKPGFTVLSTGGTLKEGALALTGYQAEKMINSFHVDKAFISCKGIDKTCGLTDSNEMDVQIKKAMLEAAKQKIFIVDQSKFDKISFVNIVGLDEIDMIITDSEPSQSWKQVFKQSDVEVKYE